MKIHANLLLANAKKCLQLKYLNDRSNRYGAIFTAWPAVWSGRRNKSLFAVYVLDHHNIHQLQGYAGRKEVGFRGLW